MDFLGIRYTSAGALPHSPVPHRAEKEKEQEMRGMKGGMREIKGRTKIKILITLGGRGLRGGAPGFAGAFACAMKNPHQRLSFPSSRFSLSPLAPNFIVIGGCVPGD